MLLSAVPWDKLNQLQKLCFRNAKKKEGTYLDSEVVFPVEKRDGKDLIANLLPDDPREIVKLAVKKSQEQPVLFFGKKSQFASYPAWPKEQ